MALWQYEESNGGSGAGIATFTPLSRGISGIYKIVYSTAPQPYRKSLRVSKV